MIPSRTSEAPAAIDTLMNSVFNPAPHHIYADGTPRVSGVPTKREARYLMWLEHLNSRKAYKLDTFKDFPEDDQDPTVVERPNAPALDRYPKDPYATTFKATVHMPDGTTEQWGPKQLFEAKAIHSLKNYMLPWDTRYGAEMHYDPATQRIYTKQGPNFRHGAYQEWLQHY